MQTKQHAHVACMLIALGACDAADDDDDRETVSIGAASAFSDSSVPPNAGAIDPSSDGGALASDGGALASDGGAPRSGGTPYSAAVRSPRANRPRSQELSDGAIPWQGLPAAGALGGALADGGAIGSSPFGVGVPGNTVVATDRQADAAPRAAAGPPSATDASVAVGTPPGAPFDPTSILGADGVELPRSRLR